MSSTEEDQQGEQALQTLPVGHPEAGYVAPKRDVVQGTGTVPPVEQEAWDERVAAEEEERKAVYEHEREVASREAEPTEAEAKRKKEEEERMKGKSSGSSSSSSSSKSSGN